MVGEYSTELTPEGYAVESEREPGSVQIYPASALERVITQQNPLSEAEARARVQDIAQKGKLVERRDEVISILSRIE